MKKISLTQGYVTLVDDEDHQWVTDMGKWYFNLYEDKEHGYAVRHTNCDTVDGKDKRQLLKMHRIIMEHHNHDIANRVVDHINRNCLDNRKSNLRIASVAQNRVNSRMNSNNTSGYRGVTKRSPTRWEARIKYNQTLIHLGTFKTGEVAAKAYDAKAKELFGDFAQLNFN